MKVLGTLLMVALLAVGAGTAFGDIAPHPRKPVPVKPKPRPKPAPPKVEEADATPTAPEADAGSAASATSEADAGSPAGGGDAAEAPPAPAPKAEPAPARLPDGVFEGTLLGPDGKVGEVTMMVVGGMIIDARLTVGADKLELAPSGAPYDPNMNLRARGEAGYAGVSGRFFDVDRGAGTFDGMLARRAVRGTWVAARR
ncbi:MAG: hypothetical protein H6745_17105 [Deltaproteobacteria bacterium]|nr:hypothetical protein [Deltaproteobacteria bacterium]